MSALHAMRCGCDPQEVAGLLPGRTCPRCGWLREPMAHAELCVRLEDEMRNLRTATRSIELALMADYDGDELRHRRAIAVAAELTVSAANFLAFARASSQPLQPPSPPGEQPDPETMEAPRA